MADVVILNGPGGVGKSTIAQCLAMRWPDCVHIGGDALRTFSPEDAARFLGSGSTYRAGGSLTRTYLALGAQIVLFEYIFAVPEHLELFRAPLPATARLHPVTLWAPLDAVRERERTRPGRTPLGARLLSTYWTMASNLPHLGHVVENTGSVEETIGKIEAHLALSGARLQR